MVNIAPKNVTGSEIKIKSNKTSAQDTHKASDQTAIKHSKVDRKQ